MKVLIIEEGAGMSHVVNSAQYADHHHMNGFETSETVHNMTKKGGSMDGVPKPADHYMAQVQHKIIESTKKTERVDKTVPASKAYNLLGKSGYKGMPNNHGSSVIKGIYKSGAERGYVK